jgi:hypothetical protein
LKFGVKKKNIIYDGVERGFHRLLNIKNAFHAAEKGRK